MKKQPTWQVKDDTVDDKEYFSRSCIVGWAAQDDPVEDSEWAAQGGNDDHEESDVEDVTPESVLTANTPVSQGVKSADNLDQPKKG